MPRIFTKIYDEIHQITDCFRIYSDMYMFCITMIANFQVDNARDFSDMGGFNELSRDLNHTDSDVRKNVAFVIGSAAQRYDLLFIQNFIAK